MLMTNCFDSKHDLVNHNRQEVAHFFGYHEDKVCPTDLAKLMPQFIAERHGDMVENFVCKGFSKMFYQHTLAYCLNSHGFIFPVHLLLGNTFAVNQSFILSSNLLKVKHASDFIIFDEKGAILEISEALFKHHIQPYQNQLYLVYKMKKKAFIQFFLKSQLTSIVEQVKQSEHNGYFIPETKATFQCPKKLEDIQLEFAIYLRKLAQQKNILNSKRTLTSSKFNTYRTQEGYKLDEIDYLIEVEETAQTIKGSHIEILNEDFSENVIGFINELEDNYQASEPKIISFSISFHQIGIDKFPYFIMEIFDVKNKRFTSQYSSKATRNRYDEEEEDDEEKEENKSEEQEKQEKGEKSERLEMSKEEESSSVTPVQKVISISDPSSYFRNQFNKVQEKPKNQGEEISEGLSSLTPISQRANFHYTLRNNNQEAEGLEEEMKELEKDGQELVEQEEEEEQNVSIKESVTSERKNREVAVLKGRILKLKTIKEEISLNSVSSGQNYFLTLLYERVQKQRMIGGLKKLIVLSCLMMVLFSIVTIFNDEVLDGRLNDLQENIGNVIMPSNFNQMYQEMVFYQALLISGEYFQDVEYADYIKQFVLYHYSKIKAEMNVIYDELFAQIRNIDLDQKEEVFGIYVIKNMKVQMHECNEIQYLNLFIDNLYNVLDESLKDVRLVLSRDVLSNSLFFRLNLQHQLDLIDKIISKSLKHIQEDEDVMNVQITLLISFEIVFFLLLYAFQLFSLHQAKLFQEQFLLILTSYHQFDAQNNIIQYKQLIQLLEQKNTNLYKFDYSKIYEEFRRKNLHTTGANDIKVSSNLGSRIKYPNISMLRYIVMLTIMNFILIAFSLAQYIFFKSNEEQVNYLVSFSLQSMQIKHDIDDLISQGETIKTDPLLVHEVYGLEPRLVALTGEIIDQFGATYQSFQHKQTIFTDQFFLLENDNLEYINALFKNDLCKTTPDSFYFCGSANYQYPSFEKPSQSENNTVFINKGLKGVLAYMNQGINENFNVELNLRKYDGREENRRFLSGSAHHIIFISYMLEVQEEMNYFLEEVNRIALDKIERYRRQQDVFLIVTSILIAGFIAVLVYCMLWRIETEIQWIKRGISTVPFQALLLQNISKNLAKKL